MKMQIRHPNHPADAKHYTTCRLREHFLIQNLFEPGCANLTYSHIDRIIVGGIMPTSTPIALVAGAQMGVETFFERREGGIINVGEPGKVEVDGVEYALGHRDGLYIGMGAKNVSFRAESADAPPKFYFNSCPAHASHPTTHITLAQAKKVSLGSITTSNERVINQFIHPDVLKSCQLVMGMTILSEGSVWNTMPAHTHERRMEAYFYFNMSPDTRIIHLCGEPAETRHIIVANEEAILSPSWSIHSGAGTGSYSFIWGMCGENITFTDMDTVSMDTLR